MRTRILEGEDLWALVDVPGPFQGRRDVIAQLGTTGQVVVLEEDGGRVVGYWPIWVAIHLEPLWIDPAIRRNPVAARLLVEGMRAQLQAEGITTAFAIIGHADLPTHLPMATRLGFQRMPGDLFFLAEHGAEGADGSSSGTSDLARGRVLHEPGGESPHDGDAPERGQGPPGLREYP